MNPPPPPARPGPGRPQLPRVAPPPPPPPTAFSSAAPASTPHAIPGLQPAVAVPAPPPVPQPVVPQPTTPQAVVPQPAAPAATGLAFRVLGFPVRVNLSFILVGFVLLYGRGRPVATLLTAIGVVLVSVLVHELGHALAFRAFGQESEIHLMGIFGLTIPLTQIPLSAGQMLVVAAAGPVAGLLLAAGAFMVKDVTGAGHGSVLHLFVFINVVISLANLLPAIPLDGGRILESLLQMASPERGKTVAHAVSLVVAGCALWWAMNKGYEITALLLLGIVGLNFTLLRTKEPGAGVP